MKMKRINANAGLRIAIAGWLLTSVVGATAATNLLHQEGAEERRHRMMEQIRQDMEAQQAAAAAALAEEVAAYDRQNRFPEINELLRYVTTIALFLTGVLLLGNPLAERVPALDAAVDRMQAAAPAIGIIAVLIGALDFVLDMLSYRWVGDTLPDLLLVVGGIAAIRVCHVQSPTRTTEEQDTDNPRSKLHQFTGETLQTVQRTLQGNTNRARMARYAVPLGILCIAAAVAHWMAGELMVL